MSHPRHYILLAHYQHPDAKGAQIPAEVAAQLIRRMAVEKIKQGVIRLHPPGSLFAKANPEAVNYIPEKLGSGNIPGTKFVPPRTSITVMTIPRVCRLPRYREVYGDWQLRVSL